MHIISSCIKKMLLVLIFALIFSTSADAKETVDEEFLEINSEIIGGIETDLDNFKSSLPKSALDLLPLEIFEGDFSSLSNGEVNQLTFLDFSVDYLLSFLPSVIKSFSSILALVLILSIFNTLKISFSSEGLKKAFSICSTLAVSTSVFAIIASVCELCVDYLQAICGAMNAFTPLMSGIMVMTGAISSASISNASFMLFLTIVENFIIIALVPIVKTSFSFSVVSSISGGFDLGGISRFIKNTFTGICVLLMSIFSFVLSFQSTLTQSVDSISMRTARFAIGNFIPIVGGFLSETLKTISSSMSYVKSSCGVIAIIVLISLTLPVVISLLLYRLSFNLISGISKAIGLDEECKIFDEATGLCSFILAITCLSVVVFIFAITIFIKSSVGIT